MRKKINLACKKSIWIKDSQLGYIKWDRLIDHREMIGIRNFKTQNWNIKSIEIIGRFYHIAWSERIE